MPRRSLLAPLCLMIAATSVASAQPRAPADALAAAGGYLLSAEKGARRCMLLLRAVPIQGGLAIGFPAHCRITLPILTKAVAWSVERLPGPPHGLIKLHDDQGAVMLTFDTEGAKESLAGKDTTGMEFELSPGDGQSLARRFGLAAARAKPQAAADSALATRTTPPTAPAAPTDHGLMTTVAGTYALMRGKDRATQSGCTVTLASPAGDTAKATLLAGCPDKGIVIFTPARWSISGGTLWLINAAGKKLSFDRNRAGGWDKSAGQGEPLALVKAR